MATCKSVVKAIASGALDSQKNLRESSELFNPFVRNKLNECAIGRAIWNKKIRVHQN